MSDQMGSNPTTEAVRDLKYWCKGEPSEVGKRVAKLLSDLVGGCHHLDSNQMKKVDWQNERYILIKADSHITGGGLSTFDFSALTRLVFMAHDRCIRVDISPLNPKMLKIMFHPRMTREGEMTLKHPTIEHALEKWREKNVSENWHVVET